MEYPKVLLELYEKVIDLENRVKRLEAQQKDAGKNTVIKENSETFFDEYELKTKKSVGGENTEIQRRDSTKYIFENGLYKKNRLVLAVVQAYVQNHSNVTRDELKAVFPKCLQGSLGVVEKKEIARMRGADYERRYFTAPQETIRLLDGDMYVCSQWGIFNLPQFLNRAEELGFNIRLA